MFLVLLMCLSWMPQGEPYILWMTNNKKMKVKAPPRCAGSLCTIQLLNGEKTSLPSKLIDMEKTKAYNDKLIAKRVEIKETRAKEEAERIAAEEKELAKNKDRVLILEEGDELPKYQRSNSGVSGTATVTNTEKELENRSKTMTGEGPIYVSKETITRYESHYLIQCEVTVGALPADMESATVELKVSFENVAAMTQTQALGPLVAGSVQRISFTVNQSDPITRMLYTVTTEQRKLLPAAQSAAAGDDTSNQ